MLLHHLAVLGDDLVLLEAGQALQLHLEDALRLRLGQAVAVRGQAEVRGARPSGRDRVRGGALEHLLDQRRAPGLRHQRALAPRPASAPP